MQDVPKIVLKHLRETALAEHPDPNLLAAFAEQSLGKSERAGVIEHLAQCADCRDGIALALPASEEIPVLPVRSDVRNRWLAGPVLRWGMIAAGLLLVTSLGVLQYEQDQSKNKFTDSTLNARNEQPANPPAFKAETNSVPSSANQTNTLSTAQKLSPDVSGHSLTANAPGSRTTHDAGSHNARPSSRRSVPATTTESKSAITAGVDVNHAQPEEVATAAQNQIPDELVHDRSDQPSDRPYASSDVVKAKPLMPLQDISNQSLSTGSAEASPRWAVNSAGALQRSLDGGTTWKDVNVDSAVANGSPTENLSADGAEKNSSKEEAQPRTVFRAVAAIASDVWAGGKGSRIYHSRDSGIHWECVFPSSAAAMLTGDIIGIEFSDPQRGSITTSNGEVWITTDAGQTWHRQ